MGILVYFNLFSLEMHQRNFPVEITDLETIINWIAHPFELSELILKPEIFIMSYGFSNLSKSLQTKLLGI